MDLEVIVQDSKTGTAYDISELVADVIWETTLESQPGKLTLNFVDDKVATFGEGSIVSVKLDNKGVFFGYVFKRGKTPAGKVSILAYDQMRYLKNKDTYDALTISNMTASQIFAKLCQDFRLRYLVLHASNHVVSPRQYPNKTLFEIIQFGIDETLINTGNWYIIRDNFGELTFMDIGSMRTDVYIGDEHVLLDYTFESSVDEDSYNQIKLIKENKETKKREIFLVKDSDTISQWGLLQYFEQMDETANEAQIKERAEMLLKLKNRVTKKLRLKCIGSLKVFAGSGVILGVSDLEKEGVAINQYFMVTSCTHTFKNDMHTMDLEVQVSI